MTRIFIIVLVLTSSLMADVKSPTGQIKFDTQMDGQAEMTLNSTGLGIGVTPTANLQVNGNAIVSKQLFVGGSAGSSNLNINGTLGFNFENVSSDTTLSDNSIVLVDSSSDNIVLSLPEASTVANRKYSIKKTSNSNEVIVSGDAIDGNSDVTLATNSMGALSVISHSGNWHILSLSGNGGTISADNLIAWWKLDETSGTTFSDSSSFSNDGTLMGSSNISGNTTSGIIANAMSFNGTDDYIEIPGNSDLAVGTNDFSFSVWIKRDRENIAERLFIKRGTSNAKLSWYALQLNSNNTVDSSFTISYTGGGSVGKATSTSTVQSSDGWTHIAASMDRDGNGQIFINGSADGGAVDISAFAGNIDNAEEKAFIAAYGIDAGPPSANFFRGSIDDLRIYNRLLTAAEIQAFYDQGP